MKLLKFIFPIFLLIHCASIAQERTMAINNYLRERAENNLALLAKGSTIARSVKINDVGIHITKLDGRKDLSIYWKEMGKVIGVLEGSPYYEMIRTFDNKGTQWFASHSNDQVDYSHYREFPTDFNDLYVALDPGHFGGNREEALLEARIMRMAADDISGEEDIEFYEADLNYQTALLIREELIKLGANVMITRPHGAGAMGKNFSSWLEEDAREDAKKALALKDISREMHDKITKALVSPTENRNRFALFDFYKFLDFRARAHKINEYAPNITLMLHYNASDDNRPYGDRYYRPVEANYNMMFIPGAFLDGELEKPDAKLDFIRLLLSPDLENSALLANQILLHQEQILGVGRSTIKSGSNMEKAITPTQFQGVYARNLALTRLTRGTVIYGETLVQDNATEAYQLAQKNISINDLNGDVLRGSYRCKEVAEGYVKGIVHFLDNNKARKDAYLVAVNGEDE